MAILSLSSVAVAQNTNPSISALDTINKKPTELPSGDLMPVDKKKKERADRFYDSLAQKSNRRAFSRLLHGMLIVHPDDRGRAITGDYVDETRLIGRYDGKTIGEITIERRPVFERERSLIQKAANNLHHMTRESTVRRDLLFRSGDRLDPDQLVRNSRLLRSRSYIYDVEFQLSTRVDDSTFVDIKIITYDSWSIGLGLRTYDHKESTFEIYDANILGTGDRLGIKTNFKWDFSDYGGNVFEYVSPNMFGTFITGHMVAGRDFGKSIFEAGLGKDFILPDDHAGGISYSKVRDLRREIYMPDTLHREAVKGRNFNAWTGRSFYIRPINSSIFITGRYSADRFSERPPTDRHTNPAFHNRDDILFGLGLYREKFYATTLLYGYGYKEYLGAGYKIEAVGGYSWGEFSNSYYIGLGKSIGGFSRSGYFKSALDIGSYYDIGAGSWRRSALNLEINWFSHLISLGRSMMRQFMTLNYTWGWNRESGADELLTFRDDKGPFSLDKYVVGRNRTVLNTETVVFTPWQPVGFRVALFGFADFGLIGNNNNIFRNDFYTTLGFGIRLKNERLIFKSIQIGLALALGKGGLQRNRYFTISSERRVNPYRFIPRMPSTVDYR